MIMLLEHFVSLFFFSQVHYCLGKQEMPNNSFEQDAHYAIASFAPLKLGVRSKIYENRVKNIKKLGIVGAGPDGPHDSVYKKGSPIKGRVKGRTTSPGKKVTIFCLA